MRGKKAKRLRKEALEAYREVASKEPQSLMRSFKNVFRQFKEKSNAVRK